MPSRAQSPSTWAASSFDGDSGSALGPGVESSGPILLGDGATIEDGARLDGPLVIGPGAKVGSGARLKDSVLLPGAEVPADALLSSSIFGRRGALGLMSPAELERDEVERQLADGARHFEISHDMICTLTFGGRSRPRQPVVLPSARMDRRGAPDDGSDRADPRG